MKRTPKKAISLVLVLSLLVSLFVPATASAQNNDGQKALRFKSDGNFKIMMISDAQDTDNTREKMINFISKALDTEKPDLVVFTGDNVADSFIGATESRVRKAINNLIQPLAVRNIPFAVTFGNHDAETGVSNEVQMAMYKAYANCYAGDQSQPGSGAGTYNVPVLSSDGTKTAFNVYMMDTHNRSESGGYDGVHADQIAWYEATGNALKAANGGEAVPSLLFQHIPVLQILDFLKEVPFGVEGSIRRGTKWYVLNGDLALGALLESPCNSVADSGQYGSWLKQGDIAGAFFGHDHVNNFVGKTADGITMGYNGGAGFRAYGNGDNRCVRIFNINENDPKNYETRSVYYGELMNDHFSFILIDITSVRWVNIIILKVYKLLTAGISGIVKF